MLVAVWNPTPARAFHTGGPVQLNAHQFSWTDPESGGQVDVVQEVFEGCVDAAGVFHEHDMTFQYVVTNIDYDPVPGVTNGFSGFQIIFPGSVPELYNQQSPAVGGPWQQNAFSGQFPPFGVEWDAPLPGVGILPGETGVFSFCTFEREDVVIEAEGAGRGPAGWGHTWGDPIPEPIIDADGTASSGQGIPGSVEVLVGDPLIAWADAPTGGNEGIDWFDNDWDGISPRTWTLGDDLHAEDPTTHPGAIRNAIHDLGSDAIVLDLNASFVNQQPVDVDLEANLDFGGGSGVDPAMAFFDANNNGQWTDGEDIVLDVNGDRVFGTVANTQTFLFHGFQSVPGRLLNTLGIACDDAHIVCKKVKYLDDDDDGLIEVGEPVTFLEVIQVHNPSGGDWTSTTVADRWGAEIDVTGAMPSQGTATLSTKGKSEKEFLKWEIGDLGPGETANLVLDAMTDLNPGGKQEYSECGRHEFNSGAVLKFRNPAGKQRSFETGGIVVSVDCDGD